MTALLDDARALVRIWLSRHLILYSDRYQKPGGWSDLYVHRAEVDAFLAGRWFKEGELTGTGLDVLDTQEAEYRATLSARSATAAEAGHALPIEELRAAFHIDDDRVLDVVLALFVVEVDPEFARSASHAWCDFTKKVVEIGFLLELVARTADDRDRLIAFFLRGDHPLFRLRALEVEPASLQKPLLHRPVRLADRVIECLSGLSDPPAGVPYSLDRSGRPPEDVFMPDDVSKAFFTTFRRMLLSPAGRNRLLIHGPVGTGRRSMCQAGATSVGRPLLTLSATSIPGALLDGVNVLLSFFREARVQGALPLVTDADELDHERRFDALELAYRAYNGALLFTAVSRTHALVNRLPGLLDVRVPHPTPDVQRALWARALPPDTTFSAGFSLDDIVARYSLAGGTIAAVTAALDLGAHGRRARGALSPGNVLPVIRDHLGHRLGSVAVPVARGFAWVDLVVPEQTQTSLRELVSFVRNRDRIVKAWGFGAKLAYGRGVAALFHGPPGTGKTMAASIIGTELAMEVFQIDLSRIVDKYIGETEKNLGKVFDEGARSQAILLFDEADSLFGKRTSVQTSVDRYANLEVNFLLQRIEHYEGICILTSNNPENIDDAFKRRIRFKVEFPFPEVAERERLWKTMMPPEAPVADDLDYRQLAERFEVSGAHVKSIILRGAAMAADEAGVITQDVLIRAGRREYAEMGKLVRTS